MVFLFNIKSSMHRVNQKLLVDTPISVAYSHPFSSYINHSKVKPSNKHAKRILYSFYNMVDELNNLNPDLLLITPHIG